MNTFPRSSDPKKKCVAHALYDNLAETPDELAFRRGDTLTVLEQNTGGLEGWWLCSLRGRQGICPGNRLRILPGVYDTSQGGKLAPHLQPPPGRIRRSWSPSRAKMSPMNQSTTSLTLDRSERSAFSRQYSGETYDTPPAPVSLHGGAPVGEEEYDTPRPLRVPPPPPQTSAKPVRPSAPVPPPVHSAALYSSRPAAAADAAAPNRCSGLSITSAGSSVRSSSGSSSNRSSLEPAPEAGGARRPARSAETALFAASRIPENGTTPHEAEDYDVPRHAAGSALAPPDDGDTYDVPQSRARLHSGETYDIPPPPVARLGETDVYDSPRSPAELETEYDSPNDTLDTLDLYDSPRAGTDVYDSPRVGQDICDSLRGNLDLYESPRGGQDVYDSPRGGQDVYDSPRGGQDVYDSPRRIVVASQQSSRDSLQSTGTSCRTSTVSDTTDETEVTLRTDRSRGSLSMSSRNATYWLRSAGGETSSSLAGLGEPRELPLDLDAGLDTVQRLEQELNATVARLFGFVAPGWRSSAMMEACGVDLKLTVVRMRSALRELVQFAYGAMVATARGPEQQLGARFVQVLRPLDESVRLIESAAASQEAAGWTAEALARPQGAPADAVDQLLACAQSLNGDARQLAAFMRGNAALIFVRRPAEAADGGPSARPGLMGDYDYVCLQTRGSLDEEGDEVRSRLPEALRGSFDNLMKESQVPVQTTRSDRASRASQVDANDQQVLEFYRGQTDCHHEYLSNAIDAFFATIQNNQPPKVFVAHSKFVILSAHKLVYIGDTVHRNVVNAAVRRGTLSASDALFASLKRTVQSTKTAALQFPSALAVQQMADAVLDVSRAAGGLKLVLDETASQ